MTPLDMAHEARRYIADKRRGYKANGARLGTLAEQPTHYVKKITVIDDNGFPVRTVDMLVRIRPEARP